MVRRLIIEGDSITFAMNSYFYRLLDYQGTPPGRDADFNVLRLTTHYGNGYVARNHAIPGSRMQTPGGVEQMSDLTARAPYVDAIFPAVQADVASARGGQHRTELAYVFVNAIGANDPYSAAGYADVVGAYNLARKTAALAKGIPAGRIKVLQCTILPCGPPLRDSVSNTPIDAVNATYRTPQWQAAYGVDGLVDWRSQIVTADAADTSKFSDGLHPTAALHSDVMRPIFEAALDAAFGGMGV